MQTLPMFNVKQRTSLAGAFPVPGSTVRAIGVPSKMPGFAWGLPAGPSCPYMTKGEGTICGSCYAQQAHYTATNVVKAQRDRFNWTRQALKTAEGTTAWVDFMVKSIGTLADVTGQRFFRIHDSGDFFSPAYVQAWGRVVDALPDIHFWAPTRSWRAKWVAELVALNARPNITVRPSALSFDEAPPVIPGLSAGSGAGKAHLAGTYACPASTQGNQCGDCRACWTAPDMAVMYHAHGNKVKDKPKS